MDSIVLQPARLAVWILWGSLVPRELFLYTGSYWYCAISSLCVQLCRYQHSYSKL